MATSKKTTTGASKPTKAAAEETSTKAIPTQKAELSAKGTPVKAVAKRPAEEEPPADSQIKKDPASKNMQKNASVKKTEKKTGKDGLTPEEKARKAKLKATLLLLKADPEWPAFLEEQKEALLKLRDQLLPNMQDVTRDHLRSGASNVSSSSGQHIGDAGSEAEVRALTISLLGKDREQLFEIDAALERIRRGYYGICEVSLEPIPKKRLKARPFCRLTVKCQEEFEKKYGSYANYKAQKSDHVGYAGLQNDMENVFSLDESEE